MAVESPEALHGPDFPVPFQHRNERGVDQADAADHDRHDHEPEMVRFHGASLHGCTEDDIGREEIGEVGDTQRNGDADDEGSCPPFPDVFQADV